MPAIHGSLVGPADKAVDQIFHAILRAHRTGNRTNNGSHYDQMRNGALAQIAQHKRKRAVRIS